MNGQERAVTARDTHPQSERAPLGGVGEAIPDLRGRYLPRVFRDSEAGMAARAIFRKILCYCKMQRKLVQPIRSIAYRSLF
jgi:hypothetical protein